MYDKTGLLELAEGLQKAGVQLLGSGGTAKKIRDAGIPIKYVSCSRETRLDSDEEQGCIGYHESSRDARWAGEDITSYSSRWCAYIQLASDISVSNGHV